MLFLGKANLEFLCSDGIDFVYSGTGYKNGYIMNAIRGKLR